MYAASRLNLSGSKFTRAMNEKIDHARKIIKCLDYYAHKWKPFIEAQPIFNTN